MKASEGDPELFKWRRGSGGSSHVAAATRANPQEMVLNSDGEVTQEQISAAGQQKQPLAHLWAGAMLAKERARDAAAMSDKARASAQRLSFCFPRRKQPRADGRLAAKAAGAASPHEFPSLASYAATREAGETMVAFECGQALPCALEYAGARGEVGSNS
jgi:hypothetical protein